MIMAKRHLKYLVLLMAIASSSQADVKFIGIALDKTDNTLLYKELHCEFTQSTIRSKVVYLNRDNQAFAHKNIFRGSPIEKSEENVPGNIRSNWVPEYKFTHYKFGFSESLAYENNAIVLSTKGSANSKRKYTQLNISKKTNDKPMIADAGFDRFIIDNIERLDKGDPIEINYLSAPRLTELSFAIQLSESEENTRTFTLQPTNFIIRLLLDPIRVTYQRNPIRLLSFNGLTNVPKTPSKNFTANIQYQYDINTLKDKQLNELCQ